jgi:hypothetical protein
VVRGPASQWRLTGHRLRLTSGRAGARQEWHVFTGIVNSWAPSISRPALEGGRRIAIGAPRLPGGLGGSIAVDGVCQRSLRWR